VLAGASICSLPARTLICGDFGGRGRGWLRFGWGGRGVLTLLRALFSTARADEIVRFVCSRVRRWGDSPARTLVIWEEGEVVAALGGAGCVIGRGEALFSFAGANEFVDLCARGFVAGATHPRAR
jgi:hypothetical protein